jgi:hypothetical protein
MNAKLLVMINLVGVVNRSRHVNSESTLERSEPAIEVIVPFLKHT